MKYFLARSIVVLAFCLCHAGVTPVGAQWNERAPLDRVTRIFDTKSGEELELAELIEKLSVVDAVFLGETHTDEVTHRVEWAVYESLLDRRGNRVVLAMEMFDGDAQEALDRYISGEIEEDEFLRTGNVWSNYRTGYRPLIELAKARKLPVVASNLPRSARRQLFGGKAAWEKLGPELRKRLPAELFPNSDAYWGRFERVVRGHAGMMMGGDDPEARLYSIQSLWDNTMGWSCARALANHPGSLVLHVNGGFHSRNREGTVEQFQKRSPDARVATVDISPTSDLARVGKDLDPDLADFVVFTESRAQGLTDGFHTVSTSRDLKYRLSIPRGKPGPHPLVVWLHRDGLSSADALRYWRVALGKDVALASVDAPYPQLEDDLHRGGRWFWDRDFMGDVGVLRSGLYRVFEYVTQHYPIDTERMILAGEGAGGTVVASLALYRSELPVRCLVIDPRRYKKLKDLALPDPEMKRVSPSGGRPSLRVVVAPEGKEWWTKELEDYGRSGVVHELTPLDPGDTILARAEEMIRQEFALPEAASTDADPKAETHLLVSPAETPLASFWTERFARSLRSTGHTVAIMTSELQLSDDRAYRVRPLAFSHETFALGAKLDQFVQAANVELEPRLGPDAFADGFSLPVAPGAFGGTTLVVVSAETTGEEKERWRELETKDVLRKRSRFTGLKVAIEGGERSLATVLLELQEAGKSNVLVVPAAFYAGADRMRQLQSRARDFLESMQISWQPGLGSELRDRRTKPKTD